MTQLIADRDWGWAECVQNLYDLYRFADSPKQRAARPPLPRCCLDWIDLPQHELNVRRYAIEQRP